MDTALPLILLVSEILKIPRAKVEVHFLKKFPFITKKMFSTRCLRKMSKDNSNRNLKNTHQHANSYVQKFPHYLVYSTNQS